MKHSANSKNRRNKMSHKRSNRTGGCNRAWTDGSTTRTGRNGDTKIPRSNSVRQAERRKIRWWLEEEAVDEAFQNEEEMLFYF